MALSIAHRRFNTCLKYSGGIVSSAIDGINCAKAALRYLFPDSEPSEEASEATE